MPEVPVLYSIPETAKILRVGKTTVRKLIAAGELAAVNLAAPGAVAAHRRVSAVALIEFIARRQVVKNSDRAEEPR